MKTLYSKWSKKWTPYPLKEEKQYEYIPHILNDILEERGYTIGPMDQAAENLPNDPRNLAPTIAAVPRPSKEDLQAELKSRMELFP